MDSAPIVDEAVKESIRLLAILVNEARMRDEATAVRLMADTYRQTGSVDLHALDKCIRRMRIAAVSGKYPESWPADLSPN